MARGRQLGRCSGTQLPLLVPLSGFALAFCLLLTACRSSALVITAAPLPTPSPILPTATPGPVMVSVDGAVNRPGQYTLPPRSRVNDVVQAAGGPTVDADLERINLALILYDGERVHVPSLGEVIPTFTPYGVMTDGRIDINRAGVPLLETLPGIGPTIALRIVEYREMNGPFGTIEDVQKVSGIGPAKLEGIRGLISVGEGP